MIDKEKNIEDSPETKDSPQNTPPEANSDEFKTAMTMSGEPEEKNPEMTTSVTVSDASTDEPEKGGSSAEPGTAEHVDKPKKAAVHGHILADGDKIGKYVIDKRLGKGGMGEVYLATHEKLGIQRAIKILPKEIAEKNSQFLTRFIREAKTACEIRHSNVVNVMDVETDEERGLAYIVMEYVDGGDVRGLLKVSGHLTVDQSVVIIEAVASALAAASEFGIVHRDIKPDNIMLTRRGDVKLADLGIAKSGDEDVQLTKTNVMMGTPAYLSPEQARDAKHVDVRADIYSLGATFFEMLTGRIPYEGASTYDILSKLFSDPVPNPCDYNTEVPPEIGKIVVTMMAKDPAKRYQSAAELLEVLVNCRHERRTVVESQKLIRDAIATAFGTEAVAYTTVHGRRRKRGLWKLIAVSAVIPLILVIAGIVYLKIGQKESLPPPPVPFPVTPNVSGPKTFHVTFRITPGNASVVLKDRSGKEFSAGVGSGDIRAFEIPRGFYLYSIKADGFRSVDAAFEIGENTQKEITMVPAVVSIQSEPNAAIQLSRDGKTLKSAVADDKGTASFSALPSGTYLLSATLAGRTARREEIVIPGDRDLTHVFRLAPVVSEIRNYRLNFNVAPPEARIILKNKSGEEMMFSSKVGGVCSYELPPGLYLYRVEKNGCAPQDGKLDLKENTDLPAITLKPYLFTVSSRPGVKLELLADSQLIREGVADKDGACVFRGVPGGKYEIRASLAGYDTKRLHAEVGSNSDSSLKLDLVSRKTTFSLTLNLPQGKARAELTREDGKMPAVIVNISGNHSFPDLRSGNYVLLLTRDGYENYRESFTITEDEAKEIVMKKIPVIRNETGGIILRTVKSNNPELEKFVAANGLEIKVQGRSDSWTSIKFPYTIKDLPPGEYIVIFRVAAKKIKGQPSEPIKVGKGKFTDYTMTIVTF